MHGLRVFITPEDIMGKLSPEDKQRFNRCIFTDVQKERDGSITIECMVFNDSDPYVQKQHRQRYFSDGLLKIEK